MLKRRRISRKRPGADSAANYSRELADYIIYVIDVSGGDKIPRKGGPGISQSDLLIVNKVGLLILVATGPAYTRLEQERGLRSQLEITGGSAQ